MNSTAGCKAFLQRSTFNVRRSAFGGAVVRVASGRPAASKGESELPRGKAGRFQGYERRTLNVERSGSAVGVALQAVGQLLALNKASDLGS